MLKRIDRYIIGKYLRTFLFAILIFSAIAVVFDFSEKVSKFIDKPVTAMQVLREHYLPFLPWINGLLFPIYALITVVFISSRMAYNSEVISIFAAGVSFRRYLRPFVISAFIVMSAHLVGNHILIPRGNLVLKTFENEYVTTRHVKNKSRHVHIFIGPDTKVYVRYYRNRDTTGTDFRLERFDGTELKEILSARTIEWLGPPNLWRLRNYEIQRFEDSTESLEIYPRGVIDTALNLYPEDFVWVANQKEMMTTADLVKFMKKEQEKGVTSTKAYSIEVHRRTAEPFTIIILTILGAAIASRKVRGGMGVHLAMGVILGAAFIFLSKFAITFAVNPAVPAMLGVWIPNLVFSVLTVYLLLKAQQ
jgi:lipopolysaccharide export system permease protein